MGQDSWARSIGRAFEAHRIAGVCEESLAATHPPEHGRVKEEVQDWSIEDRESATGKEKKWERDCSVSLR